MTIGQPGDRKRRLVSESWQRQRERWFAIQLTVNFLYLKVNPEASLN